MSRGQLAVNIMGAGALLGAGFIWLTETKPGKKLYYNWIEKYMKFEDNISDFYKSKIKKYKN